MPNDYHGYVPGVPFGPTRLGVPLSPPPSSVTHYHVGSIQEQMGMDGASKLAAAIQRLCDILEGKAGDGGSAG